MTQYSKANFISLYNTTFADNTSGDISEADMRQFATDAADSIGAGLFTTKVTISSAQILALNTTPITLLAAPGAGFVNEVISVTFFLDYNSIPYATYLTVDMEVGAGTTAILSSTVLNNSVDTFHTISPSVAGAGFENTILRLKAQTGNPTAGNSPLNVYLTYRIITL